MNISSTAAIGLVAILIGCSTQPKAPKAAPPGTHATPVAEPSRPAAQPTPASASIVRFASHDRQTQVRATLQRPARSAPGPALVFLPGCRGLGRSGKISGGYQRWADHLTALGYTVLLIDSTGSRGLPNACASRGRKITYEAQPQDAYGALRYLQTLPFISGDKIALLGWSLGGGVALHTIASRSTGRPQPPPASDFKAAIVFYPSACSERLQSERNRTAKSEQWSTTIPLLVLQGEADTITSATRCAEFIDSAKGRGSPVQIRIYPIAVHAFDLPEYVLRDIKRSRPAGGIDAARQANAEAHNESLRHVEQFLGAQFGSRAD